jgi:putative DNA-invertase from lambdoid prophage Rac
VARTFAYCRVSTDDQTTENQLRQINDAGFEIEPKRVVSETISGSSSIEQRPGFMKLLDRLEAGDVLIVTKMDRLGRNAIDVATVVKRLAEEGIKVHCLQLGGTDLTSPSGKMISGLLNVFAEFERDLIIERTQAGLKRAWAAGKVSGRRAKLNERQRADVRAKLAEGVSVSRLSRDLRVSRMTVMRARDEVAA